MFQSYFMLVTVLLQAEQELAFGLQRIRPSNFASLMIHDIQRSYSTLLDFRIAQT